MSGTAILVPSAESNTSSPSSARSPKILSTASRTGKLKTGRSSAAGWGGGGGLGAGAAVTTGGGGGGTTAVGTGVDDGARTTCLHCGLGQRTLCPSSSTPTP